MKIAVVGGCGHVGLPLAVSLAAAGANVASFDINPRAVTMINEGEPPFFEKDLKETLDYLVTKR